MTRSARAILEERKGGYTRIMGKLDEFSSQAEKLKIRAGIIAHGKEVIRQGKKYEDYKIPELKINIAKVQKDTIPPTLMQINQWEQRLNDAYAYLQAKYEEDASLKRQSKYKSRDNDIEILKESITKIKKNMTPDAEPVHIITIPPTPIDEKSEKKIKTATRDKAPRLPDAKIDLGWGDVDYASAANDELAIAQMHRSDLRRGFDKHNELTQAFLMDDGDKVKKIIKQTKAVSSVARDKIDSHLHSSMCAMPDFAEIEKKSNELGRYAKQFKKTKPQPVPQSSCCTPITQCCSSFWNTISCGYFCTDESKKSDQADYAPLPQSMS